MYIFKYIIEELLIYVVYFVFLSYRIGNSNSLI